MNDPLNFAVPLAGVDTTLPLLPEADYVFQVVESVVQENKDKNGNNWNLKLALANGATAVDGREVKPNFPVFLQLAMQPKAGGSGDTQGFLRGLGEAVDAIFQTTKDNRPDFTPKLVADAVGKMVIAQTKLSTWEGTTSTKVKKLKPYVG